MIWCTQLRERRVGIFRTNCHFIFHKLREVCLYKTNVIVSMFRNIFGKWVMLRFVQTVYKKMTHLKQQQSHCKLPYCKQRPWMWISLFRTVSLLKQTFSKLDWETRTVKVELGTPSRVVVKIKTKTLSPPFFIYCVRKIFQKTNIYYPLVCTRWCAYQGLRNFIFSENFTCALNGWSLSISQFKTIMT